MKRRTYGDYAQAAYNTAKNVYGAYRTVKPIIDTVSQLRSGKRWRDNGSRTTTTNKRRKMAQTGKVYKGNSGGFATRKRIRRNSKKNKVTRQSCTYTYETGVVYTATSGCAVIGHATHPATRCMLSMWTAVVKSLLQKVGVSVSSLGQDCGLQLGDSFTVYYQSLPASGSALSISFSMVGNESIQDIATILDQSSNPWNDHESFEIEFLAIEFAPNTGGYYPQTTMRLDSYYVTVVSKSSLKIQNRSIETAGDDENDVDNVPLYGKTYSGMGAGTEITGSGQGSTYGATLFCNPNTGLITANTATSGYDEPLNPSHIKSAKASGSVRIEPGHIKTSVLSMTKKGKFSAMYRLFTWYRQSAASIPLKEKTGKFCLWMLEKMITPTATSGDLVLAAEHNLELSSYGRSYPSMQLLPKLVKTYVTV